jgi:hypothetical protein
MEFTFTTAISDNGRISGIVKEGTINENGEIVYTKSEKIDDNISFRKRVTDELRRRASGPGSHDISRDLKNETVDDIRNQKEVSRATVPEPNNKRESVAKNNSESPVKIGVTVNALTDDEFIEYIKNRVRINKEFDRFKNIKRKIRESLEGQVYNERAFNLFIKLNDIEKRGFFNRTEEDVKVINEAVRLYGAA